jgi:3-deoxy-manno-octulosonate cytidylyltransferase (CMP-KDO synthetase)
MSVRIVIPARFASTRFPGKPLALLRGRPLVAWVVDRAREVGPDEVIVATDDARIARAAADAGAIAVMTEPSHPTGTDRIAEVARQRRFGARDVIVNLQGDEPRMPAVLVAQVTRALEAHPRAALATASSPVPSHEAFLDANVVKVVADAAGRALYFSRAPIPCDRDALLTGSAPAWRHGRRHVGLYAYRTEALLALASLEPSPLEQLERLEQLRALENGLEIRVVAAAVTPGPDVNTPEDLERLERELTPG